MMSKLPFFMFVALALIQDVCNAGLTPPSDFDTTDFNARPNSRRMLDNAPVTKKELNEGACSDMSDNCHGCLQMKCYYVVYNTSVAKCLESKPDDKLVKLVSNESQCPSEAEAKPTQSRIAALDNSTTTSTTTTPSSTTTTSSEAPSTTSTTTASSTSSSTTTTSTATSTTSETSTTSLASSSTAPSTTSTSTRPPTTSEDPDARQGNKFDGWSFFGGILLTVGISSIGFVSYKYYKVRSGGGAAGTNYNRF